jgi:hypothetical protein
MFLDVLKIIILFIGREFLTVGIFTLTRYRHIVAFSFQTNGFVFCLNVILLNRSSYPPSHLVHPEGLPPSSWPQLP